MSFILVGIRIHMMCFPFNIFMKILDINFIKNISNFMRFWEFWEFLYFVNVCLFNFHLDFVFFKEIFEKIKKFF